MFLSGQQKCLIMSKKMGKLASAIDTQLTLLQGKPCLAWLQCQGVPRPPDHSPGGSEGQRPGPALREDVCPGKSPWGRPFLPTHPSSLRQVLESPEIFGLLFLREIYSPCFCFPKNIFSSYKKSVLRYNLHVVKCTHIK